MSHHPSSPPPIDSDEDFGDFENVFDKKQDRLASDIAVKTNNESSKGYFTGPPSFSDNDDFFGNFSDFPSSNKSDDFFSNKSLHSPPPLENGGSPDFGNFADFRPSADQESDSKDNNSIFPENEQSSHDCNNFADFSSSTAEEKNIPTDIAESSDFGKFPDSPPPNTDNIQDVENSPDFGNFTDFTAVRPKLEQDQSNNIFSVSADAQEQAVSIKSVPEPPQSISVKKETMFLEDVSDSSEPEKSEDPVKVPSCDVPDFKFQFSDNIPTPSPITQEPMKSVFSWDSFEDPSDKSGEVSEKSEEFSEKSTEFSDKSTEFSIKCDEIIAKPTQNNNLKLPQINTSVLSDDDDFTDFDFAAPISSNVVTSPNGNTPYHIQDDSDPGEETFDELELKQIKRKLSFNGINESFADVAASPSEDVEEDDCDIARPNISSKDEFADFDSAAPVSSKILLSNNLEFEYKDERELDSRKTDQNSIAQQNPDDDDDDFADFSSTTDNHKAFDFENNETVEEVGKFDEGDLFANFDGNSNVIKTDNDDMFRNIEESSDLDQLSEINHSEIRNSKEESPFVNFDEPEDDFDPFKTGDNESDDEFGNFGDFNNSSTNFNQPEPSEPPYSSNEFAKFDDGEEFADFGQPVMSAKSEDEFGDIIKPSDAKGNDENFGKFDGGDENDFGDFDKSGSESFDNFKAKNSGDEFGDFGDNDDDFGDFDTNDDEFATFSAPKPTFDPKQTIHQAMKTCYVPPSADLTSCSESYERGGILILRVHNCDAEFAVASKCHTLPSYTRLVATLCLSSNETDNVRSKPLLKNDFDVFSAMNDRVSDTSAPPLIPEDLMPEERVRKSPSSEHAHILSAYNTTQSEELSDNARAIVDLIPNLDYMLSNVLMFPVNT